MTSIEDCLSRTQSVCHRQRDSCDGVDFTEDKRPSSDDSSSASSSASSSRRGSAESPRSTRRQLKVLKVRKVSKENISQFQQNAAYMMSLGRQPGLKDVRESPSGPHENLSAVGNRQTAFRPVKATR
ncbi:uncharacterized protein LOC114526830 [Dendronephthya gigantea]|uniref:uncharacterized protein LOC114526830 n=1 Tax=Dendronephthya gigantea TaxID=151771 RepID=UPI00106D5F5E|nr:uncharacterized protein LOC114526830 [Dendronephthya gigantea]